MIFLLTLFGIYSSGYSPIAWSPDGQQIAIVAPAGDGERLFYDGWLWRKPDGGSASLPETRRQLWVVDIADAAGYLVDETNGTFSSPAWAPKKANLAYVTFTPTPDANVKAETGPLDPTSGKLELITKSASGDRQTLHSETGVWPKALIESLPQQEVTWSSSGRYLAFPWLGQRNFKVLNVESGSIEAEWPEATFAGWSPNGDWFAYFSSGSEEGFRLVRTGDWKAEPLSIPMSGAAQPLLWEPAGDSVLLLRPPDSTPQTRSDFAFARRVQQFRCPLVRIHLPDLNSELIAHVQRAGQREEGVVECYASLDPKNSRWALSILAKGVSPRLEVVSSESTSASFFQNRRVVFDESAFDDQVPIGAVAYSKNGDLAYRFGIPDWGAPIMIDEMSHAKRFVAPTMAMRMRGLYSLVFALERVTQKTHSAIRSNNGLDAIGRRAIRAEDYRDLGFNRAFPLDLFELPDRQAARSIELRESVNELTNDGLTLIKEAPPSQLSPILKRQLAEVELLLHYLREDYEAAIISADRIADAADGKLNDEDLLALDTVRLQCLVEVKRDDAARVEWSNLARRLDSLTQIKKDKADESPLNDFQESIINRVLLLEDQIEHPRDKNAAENGSHLPPKPE